MPTNQKVKTFATGVGAYSHPGLSIVVPTQTGSAGVTYNVGVGYIAPYVSGILPGWSTGQRPVQGTADYGIIRAVYLTCTSTVTGTANGATATIQIYRSGSSAATAATLAFTSGGTVATALTPKLIPVSATPANVRVRFGDLIVFRWAQGSTGLTLSESMLQIDLV